jgi:TMEM175 potassium channel family protein
MNQVNPEQRGIDDDRDLGRITALSDGVFAIAITLLVLNIEVPQIPANRVAEELPSRLIALVPDLSTYVISFLVIGTYWMAHRRVFRAIRSLDRGLIWLNILFLMFVAFLPFPTALFDTYSNNHHLVIYAGSLAIARLPLTAIWWYATSHRRLLVHRNLDPSTVRLHRLRGLGIPLVFLLSIGISFVSIEAAKVSWVLLFVIDSVILRMGSSR